MNSRATACLWLLGAAAVPVAYASIKYDFIRKPETEKSKISATPPVIVTTWSFPGFQQATADGWASLQSTNDRLRAVTAACASCERNQCDGSVGYGNHPDESGETTLDAMIMDGPTHSLGAVTDLKRVKNAIGVALAVMRYTKHSMLAGQAASDFAKEMGFKCEDLHTRSSRKEFRQWKWKHSCQPNFRRNVTPDPNKHCGPYRPLPSTAFVNQATSSGRNISDGNHDTIGVLVLDKDGNIAAGTSTNGATHKIPGRVADSPLVGSGCYLDNDIGAAAATGDGDVMMRFVPSYQAVESMRQGMQPDDAAQDAVNRIAAKYHSFQGAVIALNKKGAHGAGCFGLESFTYNYHDTSVDQVQTRTVKCPSSIGPYVPD